MPGSSLKAARPIATGPHDSHLSDREASVLAIVFKALADEHRIKILNLVLVHDWTSLTSITEYLGVSQSRASYHVKQLVDAGVIEGGREGNFIYYHAVDGALERLAGLFEQPPP